MVVGLALRAYAQMSPERARAELIQRRSGEKYGQGGALERDILHLLNIISARGQEPETPQTKAYSTRGDDALPTRGSTASQALRAELARLCQGLRSLVVRCRAPRACGGSAAGTSAAARREGMTQSDTSAAGKGNAAGRATLGSAA